MAAVGSLKNLQGRLRVLDLHGYARVETGMRDRLFLQRPGFNLHIVTLESWPRNKECRLRDALIADPDAAAEYAALKRELARTDADDIAACTRAKTDCVQSIMNQVHDSLGWPRETVWED